MLNGIAPRVARSAQLVLCAPVAGVACSKSPAALEFDGALGRATDAKHAIQNWLRKRAVPVDADRNTGSARIDGSVEGASRGLLTGGVLRGRVHGESSQSIPQAAHRIDLVDAKSMAKAIGDARAYLRSHVQNVLGTQSALLLDKLEALTAKARDGHDFTLLRRELTPLVDSLSDKLQALEKVARSPEERSALRELEQWADSVRLMVVEHRAGELYFPAVRDGAKVGHLSSGTFEPPAHDEKPTWLRLR